MADKKEENKESNRFAYSDSTGLEVVSKGEKETKNEDKKEEDGKG